MEEDFPRGGVQHKVSEKGHKTKEKKLFQDDQPDSHTPRKRKRKNKKDDKNSVSNKQQKKQKMEGVVSGQGSSFHPQFLSKKMLYPGMLMLGCVKQIQDYKLIITLPNGLSGTVPINQISHAYTESLQKFSEGQDVNAESVSTLSELFRVGMLVPCKFTEYDKESDKKLSLTIDPREVNEEVSASNLRHGMIVYGNISSQEDHGYVVDIGIKGVQVFLKNKQADRFIRLHNNGELLRVGQCVMCMVNMKGDRMSVLSGQTRVIHVTMDPVKLNSIETSSAHELSFASLVPGMKVQAKVLKSLNDGIMVEFNKLKGLIHKSHLPASTESYKAGKEIKCTVLYIHPLVKTVTLTYLPHLINYVGVPISIGSDELTIGDIVEEAVVKRVDTTQGVYLELKSGVTGFAGKNSLSDDKVVKISSTFRVGSVHRCRVLGYSLMEGFLYVSMKQSVLDEKHLRVSDIQPGELVECVITRLSPKGLAVELQKGIRGFIHHMHLADVTIKHPEKMFKVDDKLKCRVLNVYKDTSKVDLTNKRSLVNSKYKIINDYSMIDGGEILEGYISQVKESGCVVRFYNDVRGFVPKSMLSTDLIEYPEKVFYAGQVVRCKVIRVDAEHSKLILSFVIEGKTEFGKKVDIPSDYKVGKLVKCVVKQKSKSGIDVKLLSTNNMAFIPMVHLSDSTEIRDALWEKYQPGDTIDNAMYWNKAKCAILTCKQSLLRAAQDEEFTTDFDSLQPGMMLSGAVKNITSYGIFVEFADGLFGLVPKQYATEKRVNNLSALYRIGQTVNPKVVEVLKEKKRFLASLRMQDCYHGDTEIGLNLTWALLKERYQIQQSLSQDEGIKGTVSLIEFGSIQKVTITQVTDLGAVGELDSGVKAVIVNNHMKDGVKEGDKLDGVVLYVDVCQNCVELCLTPNLIKKLKALTQKTEMKKCRVNQTLKSTVQLVKEDFVVVSVSLQAGAQLAYIPAKRHWNDVLERYQYGLGQENKVVIKRIEDDIILASLKIHEDKEEEEDVIERIEHIPSHTLQIGDMCDAVVRKIYKDQIYIHVGGTNGRVHVTEMCDAVDNGTIPVSQFKVKQEIKVRVIGFREAKSMRYLPCSHPNRTHAAPECTMKPSILKMKTLPDGYLSNRSFKKGDKVVTLATRGFGDYLWTQVSPSVQGKVHRMNLTPEAIKLDKNFERGLCYNATVTNIVRDHLVELTFLDSSWDIVIGETTRGMVCSAKNDSGLVLQLQAGIKGVVDLTDMSDNYVDFPVKKYKQRSFVDGVVLECDRAARQAIMSLRPENSKPVDRRISSVSDLSPGQLVRGYITRVSKKRLTVRLGVGIQSNVLPTELIEDKKVVGMSSVFKHGRVVKVKIMGIGADNEVQISLKQGDTGVDLKIPDRLVRPLDAKDLKRKRSVSCSSVDSESGMESKKIKLKNTDRTLNENVKLEIFGCELMEDSNDVSDNTTSCEDDYEMGVDKDEINDYKEMIDNLDELKEMKNDIDSSDDGKSKKLPVLGSKVKREAKRGKKKLSSVKEKNVMDESESSEESDNGNKPDGDKKKRRKKRKSRQNSEKSEEVEKSKTKSTSEKVAKLNQSANDGDDESDSAKESDSGIEFQVASQPTLKVSEKPVLELTEKFSWDTEFKMPSLKCMRTSENQGETSSDDSDDDSQKPVKKTREQIREAKIAEEKKLYEIEMKRLEGGVKPETADDFDRLALESPDSSIIWLRYMAFHLETTEIDKARAVAERALKTISFREEQEKLNVWVAYLNLENMYGTPETLKKVLDRAVQQNDQISVYLKMVNVYVKSDKVEDAEHLFNILVKKHSGNKDIWIKFGEFYFNQKRIESARKLLQRSLKSLNMKLHVDIITKFAQMEFKLGEAERGKTMFENILSTYPKRTDLWSVYIDMMTKLGDHDATRTVYNRVVAQKMSAKKMKFFFKKYLQFEEKFGSEDHIAAVKKKALEYVESQGYVDEV